jgi:hypothetical protein
MNEPTGPPAFPILSRGLSGLTWNHRLEIENGCPVEDLAAWFKTEQPNFDISSYGFQQFNEFLNYAQDKTVVRMEPHEEQGSMMVYLGAEFYPPAPPPQPEPLPAAEVEEEEEYEPQPYVEGQPTIFEPNPPPAKPKRAAPRKRPVKPSGGGGGGTRRPRRKKPEGM